MDILNLIKNNYKINQILEVNIHDLYDQAYKIVKYDKSFKPVIGKSLSLLFKIMWQSSCGLRILEDINTTTTSLSLSRITSAGLLLVVVESVKGKGNRTILPFIFISIA